MPRLWLVRNSIVHLLIVLGIFRELHWPLKTGSEITSVRALVHKRSTRSSKLVLTQRKLEAVSLLDENGARHDLLKGHKTILPSFWPSLTGFTQGCTLMIEKATMGHIDITSVLGLDNPLLIYYETQVEHLYSVSHRQGSRPSNTTCINLPLEAQPQPSIVNLVKLRGLSDIRPTNAQETYLPVAQLLPIFFRSKSGLDGQRLERPLRYLRYTLLRCHSRQVLMMLVELREGILFWIAILSALAVHSEFWELHNEC
ncbi:uncharacterized protein BDR25DRAFT_349712 [Lindgomyces ingoldianus]|uniref:Uncharacterized protein n=1 Tax=Lindgomyces ingoldianus TaxID=673940 RepID=A0ACB6RBV8_9PLEO|nr:uncharacterized protein BDR25DRAFT_349712 [Lindgomyces ingoldianus]KAF2476636.1 hypothetical protein BDR25DRAFT_349712 [Lindgomyces ingoldianus]